MKYKYLFSILILLLIASNTIFMTKYFRFKADVEEILSYYSDLKNGIVKQYQLSGTEIECNAIDKNLTNKNLAEHTFNDDKIFIYLNPDGCNSCLNNLLDQIKTLQSKNDNVIILTNFTNQRHFKSFLIEYELNQLEAYNIQSTFPLKEEIDTNYFLFKMHGKKVNEVLIPSVLFPDIIHSYLQNENAL